MMWNLDTLKVVNTKVNLLEYKTQIGDDWNPFTDNGFDCNNYATRKMEELHSRGVPASVMRLATCWVFPNHEGYHCVLLVDVNGETVVLDNRYPLPMDWQVVPYEWHKFQIAGTREWELATKEDN